MHGFWGQVTAADWVIAAGGLLAGLGSGLLGALVSARSARSTAKDARRHAAALALWAFHRTLIDYSAQLLDETLQDLDLFTTLSREGLAEARAAAYSYRTLLPGDAQHLLTRNYVIQGFGDPQDPFQASEELDKWADELATVLQTVFAQD